jgi:hypothetical protein
VFEGVLLVSNVTDAVVKSVLRNKYYLLALLVAMVMIVVGWRDDKAWWSQNWVIPFWVAVTPFIANRMRRSRELSGAEARQAPLRILLGMTLVQVFNLCAWRFAEIPMRSIFPVLIGATLVQMGALVYLFRSYAKARTPPA